VSRIVGIDLGTSTSEIACLVDGKPVVIPNIAGYPTTPSVVAISPDGEITVGIEAKEKHLLEPDSTFMEVKRLMGSDSLLTAHGKVYSPQQLSAFILKYLVDGAGTYLDEDIDRVVITVPAYFSDKQRRATVEAGKLCGLTVERIINEPTAAALSYGLEHMEDCTNILVYDLGGGTLDVTALEMFEGVMEVRASSGNNMLGGKDFDEAIIEYIISQFPENQRACIQSDLRAMARLKKEAETCKISLSQDLEYTITLPFLTNFKGKPLSVDKTITRELFEDLISEKIDATQEQINIALADAQMDIEEIDLILMVGGSTQIPYVEKFITGIFNKAPQRLIDPDLAVVYGAAIQAGIIGEQFPENEIILTDVCPYTLGMTILRYGRELYFDPIIPRNTTIPVTIEKEYMTCYDMQTRIDIDVSQGEYSEPARNNFLDKFILEGIPPMPAGKERITVAFSYDVNGILQVDAKSISTGESASITISTTGSEMIEEVDISDWKNSRNARKYFAVIRRAEKVLAEDEDYELKDLLRALKEALVKDAAIEILDDAREEIIVYLLDLEDEDEDE